MKKENTTDKYGKVKYLLYLRIMIGQIIFVNFSQLAVDTSDFIVF